MPYHTNSAPSLQNQPVAITFFIKRSGGARPRRSAPHVFHAERFGLRAAKYTWLSKHDWETTDWQKVRPRSEFYLFVPRDEEALKRYNKFIKVTDIFPVNSVGIVTSRDRFVFDFDREVLKRRIRTFLDPNLPEDVVCETFKLRDSHAWSLKKARQAIGQDKDWKSKIVRCLYRPFDVQWLFYHPAVIERGREEVMRHMVRENLALCIGRAGQVVSQESLWNLVFCSMLPEDFNLFYRGGNVNFPLYLYPGIPKEDLLSTHGFNKDRKPNFSSRLLDALEKSHNKEPVPEGIYNYIYAVLYSTLYREKYAEFLRIDFPRIPFTKDVKLFQKLAALGQRLVDLHLLRSSKLDPPIARFQSEGDNRVQTGKKGLRYEPNAQWVYINEEQYFEGVPVEVWEYQIGGYQVCHKWLKDRKDRCLTLDEIKIYCRIVTALAKTIAIQAEIDTLYPEVEKSLLPIELKPQAG